MVATMRRAAVLLSVGFLLPASAHAAPAQRTGRLLVTLEPGVAAPVPAAPRATARAVAAAAGAAPNGPLVPQIGLGTVRAPPGGSAGALARRLRADPRVRAVTAERRGELR